MGRVLPAPRSDFALAAVISLLALVLVARIEWPRVEVDGPSDRVARDVGV